MSGRQLSDKYLLLLRHGDTEGRYGGDGSKVVGAIVLHAVNNRLAKATVYKMLVDPQNKGGFACLRRRRPIERWFDTIWRSAQRQAADHPLIHDKAEAAYQATTFLEAVEALPWPGRGGATDIAVLRAAVTICQRVGRVGDVAMSCRELAELAGVNYRTVYKSLRRLQTRDLIKLVDPSDGHSPSRFSLGAVRRDRDTLSYTGDVGHDCPRGVAPSDVWRWGGLGLSTSRVFALLTEEPSSASTLAEALGVHRRTTQRHLARLAEHGLAERTEDGWIRGDADLAQVAHILGVAGARFTQRRDHKKEQAQYHGTPTVVDPETGEIHQLRNLSVPAASRREGVA